MSYVTVKSRHQVTLPAKLRGELPVEEGDILEIRIKNGSFVLTPKRLTDRAALEPARSKTERMARMDAIVAKFGALPEKDPRDLDDILYDADGLPR